MTHLGNVEFENVYPAVAECFFIILSGYLAGHFKLISPRETKGLNIFISHFSLPSLIFLSLATLHLNAVNWNFLLSILIAKSVVFLSVAVVTIIVQRPVNLGKAALYSIFCTQSNDFALGYPIVEALYKEAHPEYANYLYLVAPISLVFLNPIGLIMLEIQARRQAQDQQSPQPISHMIVKIIGSVFLNPIVLMTILGVAGNFIFKQNVPLIFSGVLSVLGQAFSATALFSLGLKIVGKVSNLKRHDITMCSILIGIKILILPLIIRETVLLVNAGAKMNDTAELSTYGFLYGTFPSAPAIFVFANQYNIASDLIATAVSGCTLLAAPFIFVSAKMISLHFSLPGDYLPEFQILLFNVGIVSLVGCIFTFIVFAVFKKWRKMPHWITFHLILTQFLICIGTIIWHSLGSDIQWQHHFQFILFTTSVYASRIWAALLALSLLLLRWRSLCFLLRLKTVFLVAGWGLPLGMVLIIFFMLTREEGQIDKIDPFFVYGKSHAIASSLVLLCCLCITVFCLIVQQRFENSTEYQSLLGTASINSVAVDRERSVSEVPSTNSERRNEEEGRRSQTYDACCSTDGCHVKHGKIEKSCFHDVEDLLDFSVPTTTSRVEERELNPPQETCDSGFSCTVEERKECASMLKSYNSIQNNDPDDEEDNGSQYEFVQHTILLYLLCLSMFVGLGVSLWRIMIIQISGIYVEMEFLDGILNVGQGFFIFIVFGPNLKAIRRILNWWKILYHRTRYSQVPTRESTSSEQALLDN